MSEVTHLLEAAAAGDRRASAELLPVVYGELRKLAAVKLVNESPGHTLDATALVHEVYLRLGGSAETGRWKSRRHYFAAAAEAMRRILIDHARGKRAARRGGGRRRVPLGDAGYILSSPDALLDLDDALTRFAAEEPEKSELVHLRFFAGLSTTEAASALDISVATAERWWKFARAWLYSELSDEISRNLPAE